MSLYLWVTHTALLRSHIREGGNPGKGVVQGRDNDLAARYRLDNPGICQKPEPDVTDTKHLTD